LHAEFVIFTDQKSLIHLNEQRLNTPRQQKVFTKLLDMQYKIVYKPGSNNRVADALSRRAHEAAECLSISMSIPQWSQEVMDGYYKNSDAQNMLAKLVVDKNSVPDFSFQDGLLRFKGNIWLGNNSSMQQAVVQALHSSAVGGTLAFLSLIIASNNCLLGWA